MTQSTNDGKTIGLIAYLSLIGLLVAFIMHGNNKTEFGAYHIRQMVGITLISVAIVIVANFIGISIVAWAAQILAFVMWVLGLIGAAQGEMKPVPVVGEKFQEWFKGIA